jgi:hypothetical protein
MIRSRTLRGNEQSGQSGNRRGGELAESLFDRLRPINRRQIGNVGSSHRFFVIVIQLV